MATGPGIVIGHLRHTLAAHAMAGRSDADLLRAFAAGGPDAGPAFELLLRRHGPMVWRACTALLRDPHAAEDAFQATFLVLVRRAGALALRGPPGPWLFGVARRVCGRARAAAAARRRAEPLAARREASPAAPAAAEVAEAVTAVHEEVGRLPGALRRVVVLCELQGLPYAEAARRLGCTHAAVRGRLARARARLRWRLACRGLGPLAVPAAAVPLALVRATARAAAVAAGRDTGAISEAVSALVNGGIQSMVVTKLKSAGMAALTTGVLIAGAVGLSGQPPAPRSAPPSSVARNQADFADEAIRLDKASLDLAQRIAELARDAQKQQADGQYRAAATTLQEMEALAHQWKNRMTQQAQLDDRKRFELRGDGRVLEALGYKAAPSNLPRPDRAGAEGKAPADLEGRVRALEEKLDRILKALDGARNPPAGASGGTRGLPAGDPRPKEEPPLNNAPIRR
jgi:RNA polymerase sigma factor (sigma-70 family)